MRPLVSPLPRVTGTLIFALCTGAICTQAQPAPSAQSDTGKPATPISTSSAFDAVPAKVNFDIVSFKQCPPGRFGNAKVDMPMDADYIAYHCELISRLIYFAYFGSVPTYSLADGYPDWIDTDRYEFIAKVTPEDIAAWQKLDLAARRVLIRGVLATTLKLKISMTDTPTTVYLLTVAKSGPKLTPYKDSDHTRLPDGRTQDGRTANWVGITGYFQNSSMPQFAGVLTAHLNHRVIDRTGLTGFFNFSVPLVLGTGMDPSAHYPTDDDPSTMEGLAALGLRLESSKQPIERLSIDHIERPQEN